MRKSGILMHISSLPGAGGIGSLGKEAYAFADFLEASGMKLWQGLPMGPTGYGESPYQSFSVHAGNPMLISTEKLVADGLLTLDPGEEFVPTQDERVEFDQVRENKEKLLRKAFHQSEKGLLPEIRQFLRDERWVSDFALFTAVKQHFGGVMWRQWPDEGIKMRRKESLLQYRMMLDEDVRYHVFCQFIFFRQWKEFKAYCNSKGIELFGDMPIYVAEDSADTWTQPEVFQLDKNRAPKRVAGVPPDYFSADGQMWGNPLYRWTYLFFRRYDWWVERMRGMSKLYDIVRVDHFIGFANYYSIPYGAPNARSGKWIVGPGKKLFRRLKKELPNLRVVAEDLGVQSDRVRELLKFVGYPGMKVLQFAFDDDPKSTYLPQNFETSNCIAYTGTHDNMTLRGWIHGSPSKTIAFAKRYLHCRSANDLPAAILRLTWSSTAKLAVAQMQDFLDAGPEGRMNTPSTTGGNWQYRTLTSDFNPRLAKRIYQLNELYNRLPEETAPKPLSKKRQKAAEKAAEKAAAVNESMKLKKEKKS